MKWKSLNLHLFKLKELRVKKELEKFELDNKIEINKRRKENMYRNNMVTKTLEDMIKIEREMLDKQESDLTKETLKLSNEIEMTENLIDNLNKLKYDKVYDKDYWSFIDFSNDEEEESPSVYAFCVCPGILCT